MHAKLKEPIFSGNNILISGVFFSLHILSFQCSPLDFCVLMHHLTDISRQVEAVSETALTDLKSELLHSVIKEVDTYRLI